MSPSDLCFLWRWKSRKLYTLVTDFVTYYTMIGTTGTRWRTFFKFEKDCNLPDKNFVLCKAKFSFAVSQTEQSQKLSCLRQFSISFYFTSIFTNFREFLTGAQRLTRSCYRELSFFGVFWKCLVHFLEPFEATFRWPVFGFASSLPVPSSHLFRTLSVYV